MFCLKKLREPSHSTELWLIDCLSSSFSRLWASLNTCADFVTEWSSPSRGIQNSSAKWVRPLGRSHIHHLNCLNQVPMSKCVSNKPGQITRWILRTSVVPDDSRIKLPALPVRDSIWGPKSNYAHMLHTLSSRNTGSFCLLIIFF